ncbi:MAG: hypothetical protein JWO95_227 [Verrucomicrobiales bacterium]|nr:hypothetical protein [Verrucomicrobiales bacterium]
MSVSPDSELDLEKLFLPAWAQESPALNKYAGHTGEDRAERGRGRGGDRDRGPRRDRPPAFGGGGAPRGPGGPGGGGGGGQQFRGNRPGGPRSDRGGDQRGGGQGGPRPDFRGGRPGDRPERREPLPLPEIEITFLPDDTAIDVLGRQIRTTGRAYPLFDIAQLILQKPERQLVRFDTRKKDGQVVQPLFLCALDDTLWLSEQEAVNHVLNKHFATFYKAERTAIEPPKGVYTFVAQCGMSGAILGPPNYHDYQNQLHKLHQERFARIPFDQFKARVKIVKDEAVVKKWIEDRSFRTEYDCLNVPEPKRLTSREEVEKHFRETHLATIIKPVETYTMGGPASRELKSNDLQRAMRAAWEEQHRFPLKLATTLSQKLASEGLQFFKVNKTVTHVSVARPHYLDLEATPVSEGVRKIVEFINKSPKCTRRKLIQALAPSPAPAAAPATPTPAPAAEAPAVNGDQPAQAAAPAAPAAAPAPTPEQSVLIADLHWLIHQGHVIEFANAILETAKKPLPKPPPKPAKAAPAPATTEAAAAEAAPQANAETNAAPVEVPTESLAVATESAPDQGAPAEPAQAEATAGTNQ